jgi:hypothetical protein
MYNGINRAYRSVSPKRISALSLLMLSQSDRKAQPRTVLCNKPQKKQDKRKDTVVCVLEKKDWGNEAGGKI